MKAVIFDLDQTLIDTLKRFYIVFNKVLEMYGSPSINWDIFIKHYSDDNLDMLIPSGISRNDFWWNFLKKYNDVKIDSDSPIPGAVEILKLLKKKNCLIAVVTGRAVKEEDVWRELDEFGLSKYVDLVLTKLSIPNNDDNALSKTKLFKLASRLLNVSPSECIVVGDYWNDILGGKAIGAKLVIGVLTGHMSKEKLIEYGADIVIKNIAELSRVLNLD